MCYSWTLIGFFNKLSSFILYFTLPEIADIFAFMMTFALLESLIVLGFLLFLSAILPAGWLKDNFAFKGFVILIVMTVAAIIFQNALTTRFPPTWMLLVSLFLPVIVIAFLIWSTRLNPKFQVFLLNIVDRIQIMLFVYLPIGLFSLIVVLYRNLV